MVALCTDCGYVAARHRRDQSGRSAACGPPVCAGSGIQVYYGVFRCMCAVHVPPPPSAAAVGVGPVAADCGGGGGRTPTQMPPGPQSKIMVVKKGKITFLTRSKMTPLTPGTQDYGHLHRHPAPRNPPSLGGAYQLCINFVHL